MEICGCRGRYRFRQLSGLFRGGFKVSSGTLSWYRSRCGADFENSEIVSPADTGPCHFQPAAARTPKVCNISAV